MTALPRFDASALHAALDAERTRRALTWTAVAREIWALSHELNAIRDDHPISPATLTAVERRGETSCQHALFFLRWLGRIPEDFLDSPPTVAGAPLPVAASDRRLRWHLHARDRRPAPGLFEAMDARRVAEGLTWSRLGVELGTAPARLTGLRRARYATGIGPAMSICQWLRRPAADFVYAARW